MKILMSALACEPGKGSELEVGFRALLAAASQHEVWVLTNSATIPTVRRAIGMPGQLDTPRGKSSGNGELSLRLLLTR